MSNNLKSPRGIVIGHQHSSTGKVWLPPDKLSHSISKRICSKEMTREEYEEEVFGIFTPDPRILAINDKFDEYRANTRDCNNIQASVYYRRLMSWCDENGYSLEDISTAKRKSGGRR